MDFRRSLCGRAADQCHARACFPVVPRPPYLWAVAQGAGTPRPFATTPLSGGPVGPSPRSACAGCGRLAGSLARRSRWPDRLQHDEGGCRSGDARKHSWRDRQTRLYPTACSSPRFPIGHGQGMGRSDRSPGCRRESLGDAPACTGAPARALCRLSDGAGSSAYGCDGRPADRDGP